MRRRILVLALVLLPGLALAALAAVRAGAFDRVRDRSGVPMERRFREADSWESYLDRHDEQTDGWRSRYERAGATVARSLPEARTLARDAAGPWRLLAVTEPWCGDSRRTLPYLARLAEGTPGLELRLLPKRDAADLLAAHPHEDGREAIPLILLLDGDYRIRGRWVEQPAPLRALIDDESGRLRGDALHDRVLAWYDADEGRTATAEVLALIRAAAR